MSIIFSSL